MYSASDKALEEKDKIKVQTEMSNDDWYFPK